MEEVSLLETIKMAGLDAIDAANPVAIFFGTVIRVEPLEINVEERFTLTEPFLILTDGIQRRIERFDLTHRHDYQESEEENQLKQTESALGELNITIKHGLMLNDRVILLRIQGGQQFVVLDKVVSK